MRRLVWAVLLAAACKPVEVGQGRYRCDPSGNREVGSAQCPGSSRCGLDGFCHDIGDTHTAWPCQTADDCEGGWQCGVTADGVGHECHDPDAGVAYRCLTSSDCSRGWTCGLDEARLRRCHDPLTPKAWPCESSADCVASWECGLNDLRTGRECHDPANPRAFACQEDADCVAGWRCGLDQSERGECHDPAKPSTWRCHDDGDCLGGWRCGLDQVGDGECHDPANPSKWRCVTDAHCVAGWRCGLNDLRTGRECHDPATPRDFACEVESDCVAGWRCGLADNRVHRECHDPQNPRAWACKVDGDCLGGWRCTIDERCANPIDDALEPVQPLDGGAPLVLSPLDTSEVSTFAVSPAQLTSDKRDVLVVGLVRGGQLEAVSGDQANPLGRWVLGPAQGPVLTPGARWIRNIPNPPNNGPYQARVETPVVFSGLSDGGLVGFELLRDGGVQVSSVFDSRGALPPITAMRHGVSLMVVDGGRQDGADLPYLAAFSPRPDRYVVFDGLGDRASVRSIVTRAGLQPINRVGNQVRDLADLYFEATPAEDPGNWLECTFLVDSSGLWASQNDISFEPLHLPPFGNSACGPSQLRVESFTLTDPTHALVVAAPWDGGTRQVAAWDLSPMLPAPSQSRIGWFCSTDFNSCGPFESGMPSVVLGPCQPCPTGVLLDATSLATAGHPNELEARCGLPDGGAYAFYNVAPHPVASGACVSRFIASTSSLLRQPSLAPMQQASTGRTAFSGPGGRVWVGPTTAAARALTFDQPALGLVRTSTSTYLVGEGAVGTFSADIGFIPQSRLTPTAVAQNEPTWAILNGQVMSFARATSLDDGRPLAVATNGLAEPQVLLRARAPSGETVAIVGAGDEVWTAAVDDTSTLAPPPALLAPRLQLPAPLSSLAVTASPDAGTAFIGYATTAFGLTRLEAESPTLWFSTDVSLPGAGSPLEAWFTNGRARVGLDTGAVLALPSRVAIAPPLTDPVVDYAQGCGRQLALTRHGLYELVAVPQASVGAWRPLPLPPNVTLEDGRVFVVDDQLWLTSSDGVVARLSLAPCQ